MIGLDLGTAAAEPSQTHHNHLGEGHILATVAHSLDIISLHWWLVVNCCLSCTLENGNKTSEYLEMAAVKEGNNTNVADAIDWEVSLIGWHFQSQFVNHYTRMLNYHPDAVAS
jgi:hypothetical protein